MKEIVNWGIIGAGNAAINLAKNFKDLPNAKLVGIASKNEEKRLYFKNEFKINKKNIYQNYESILENKDIDIVYIALPHNMHKEWCINASIKKKHILVEKPATLSAHDIKQVINQVKKDKVFFAEGIAYQFHPFFLEVLSTMKQINPNDIISIKSSFGNDTIGGKKIFGFRFKKPKKTKRHFNPNLGGGAIWDTGCYPISATRHIVSAIYGDQNIHTKILDVKKKIGSTGVDEHAYIELQFNAINAYLETSLDSVLKNNIEIELKNGKITIVNPWFPEKSSYMEIFKNGKKKIIKPFNEVDTYKNEIKIISDLIIEGKLECENLFSNYNDIYQNILILEKWFKFKDNSY